MLRRRWPRLPAAWSPLSTSFCSFALCFSSQRPSSRQRHASAAQSARVDRDLRRTELPSNYVFKPTAEEVARIIPTPSRGGGLTRR